MPAEQVDFLIVTALAIETASVRRLLEDPKDLPDDILGSVPRSESLARYSIAVTEIGRMGTAAAQAVAAKALLRLNPKRVVLVGIAAGFPESGIEYGDVMVPYGIMPYGLVKVS